MELRGYTESAAKAAGEGDARGVVLLLLGRWGLASLYDGAVYLWQRHRDAASEGGWQLLLLTGRARSMCVADLPAGSGGGDGARWLVVEDHKAGIVTMPLDKDESPAGHEAADDVLVDGDKGLWTRCQDVVLRVAHAEAAKAGGGGGAGALVALG